MVLMSLQEAMSNAERTPPAGCRTTFVEDLLQRGPVGVLELRGFLARLLGWTRERAVDQALRSIELATAHLAHLVLCGGGDLVPIARALHRRAVGAERPFILCDPRRRDTPASVRSPANYRSGAAALLAAAGGSLCVRYARLPEDFASVTSRVRNAHDVQYIVCSDDIDAAHPLLVMPAPIRLPPLAERAAELPRIVDEYALDAIAALGVRAMCFTDRDRAWVLAHEASSFSEIEKATLRLVALRTSSVTGAAERLGMAPVSLSRWVDRRGLSAQMTVAVRERLGAAGAGQGEP